MAWRYTKMQLVSLHSAARVRMTVSADVGFAMGNVVYINAGFMSRNILKHEIGHTLGLPHSSRGSEEYGDRWVGDGAGRAGLGLCSAGFLDLFPSACPCLRIPAWS